MDIGMYHIKTMKEGRGLRASDLFTVDDGHNVYIYQRPYGASTVAIRRAVVGAFIDDQGSSSLSYRIAGRYPNWRVGAFEVIL
jgi:hypothetical protein